MPTSRNFVATPLLRIKLVVAASLLSVLPAYAQTQFNSLASFQAATSTTLRATFESFSEGSKPTPLTDTGVTFSTPGGGPLYTAVPGGAASGDFALPLQSTVLTQSGNENFNITFPGLNPTAVGFDVYTNGSTAPVISIFDLSDVLIVQFSVVAPTNSLGYFGVVTPVPIGRINYVSTNGNVVDTGIDNVRVGISAIAPEPGTFALLSLGSLGIVGVALHKRCRA
jgi:hypothetical protein